MIARTVETAHVLTTLLRGAQGMVDDLGWAAWRWYQIRRSVRLLSSLDDHMLSDIGVSRSMIVSATLDRVAAEEAIRRRVPW